MEEEPQQQERQVVKKITKKKLKAPDGTCPICLEKFTAIIRQPIKCPYCPSSLCRVCAQNYLLNTLNDPSCMACKREWNHEFIDMNLTQTFRKGPLRKHRRIVLIDREKGRLPGMQVYVEATKEINKLSNEDYVIRLKVNNIYQEMNMIQSRYNIKEAGEEKEKLKEEIDKLKQTIRKNTSIQIKILSDIRIQRAILNDGVVKIVKQFIMKCPSDDCRGFLSSAWKCGTCLKFFCSDCHALKKEMKDETHICNADDKATASMISKETKPCPKCGIRISKIDGCDQMWCTGCHATFSWNTGQLVVNAIVHNPHYYEYLRKANNGVIAREVGDIPCGGLPDIYTLSPIIMKLSILSDSQKADLIACFRCITDIQYDKLPRYPITRVENANKDIDIQYLMNNVTEEQWGETMEKQEISFERKKEIGLILQTFVHIGSEKFTQLNNAEERNKIVIDIINEMYNIRNYTNNSLHSKGKQMDVIVPFIQEHWQFIMMRKSDIKLAIQPTDENIIICTGNEWKTDIKNITNHGIYIICKEGLIDKLKYAVENNKTVKSIILLNTIKEYNPLIISIKMNKIECVKYLVEVIGLDITEINDEFIKYCIKHDTILEYFIKSRHVKFNEYSSVLYENILLAACKIGNLKSIRLLIEYGGCLSKIDNKCIDKGFTPLILACELKYIDISIYLIEKGADINLGDKYNSTPIFYACKDNNLNNLIYLTEKGADINHKNIENYTPLLWAASIDNYDAIEYLHHHGANINAVTKSNHSALYLTLFNIVQTVQQFNISPVKLKIIELLLKKGDKTIINLRNSENECIFNKLIMTYNNSFITADLLYKNGADINMVDAKGNTLLINLIISKDMPKIKQLLKYKKIDLTIKNNKKKTAYDLALKNNTIEELLLKKGYDPETNMVISKKIVKTEEESMDIE